MDKEIGIFKDAKSNNFEYYAQRKQCPAHSFWLEIFFEEKTEKIGRD